MTDLRPILLDSASIVEALARVIDPAVSAELALVGELGALADRGTPPVALFRTLNAHACDPGEGSQDALRLIRELDALDALTGVYASRHVEAIVELLPSAPSRLRAWAADRLKATSPAVTRASLRFLVGVESILCDHPNLSVDGVVNRWMVSHARQLANCPHPAQSHREDGSCAYCGATIASHGARMPKVADPKTLARRVSVYLDGVAGQPTAPTPHRPAGRFAATSVAAVAVYPPDFLEAYVEILASLATAEPVFVAAAGLCLVRNATEHQLARATTTGTPGTILMPEAGTERDVEISERVAITITGPSWLRKAIVAATATSTDPDRLIFPQPARGRRRGAFLRRWLIDRSGLLTGYECTPTRLRIAARYYEAAHRLELVRSADGMRVDRGLEASVTRSVPIYPRRRRP